ncbi:alpha/beta hydrolase [Demequina zhanjiangensis]|uniref:Alpha/beta hydrolase-fold protein n=1 Tax=Demequina zhanjiangensis TaxID=3051659 RepID=A0ABT8FYF5_9MICO|nr:alpha/beta hydrolase-fold protein [Demequina sp. SYSU T00b26]MDN4471926.1 alpha/beta hydrolase-fold protein [Demequina sp. SYSU T00b26]
MTRHSRRSGAAGAVAATVAAFVAGCSSVDVEPDGASRGAVPSTEAQPSGGGGSDAGLDPVPALVPDAYRAPAEAAGTLEVVQYASRHDPEGASEVAKEALVYLPPGYGEADASARYDVLYLMHGGGGGIRSWMGDPSRPTALPSIFDHMIADGLVRPMIVVAPTYDTGYGSGGATFQRNVEAFTDELVEDLIPVVEERFRTFAESVDADGLEASREHRAFGGFSMGGVTTWHMLENATEVFAHYLPMSGDSWNQGMMGGLSATEATVAQLEEGVRESGYGPREVFVFSATGSEDMAVPNMDAMAAEVREGSDVFAYTDRGFSEGNFMYWVVEGHLHDYPWGYDYVYSGLQMFFPVR